MTSLKAPSKQKPWPPMETHACWCCRHSFFSGREQARQLARHHLTSIEDDVVGAGVNVRDPQAVLGLFLRILLLGTDVPDVISSCQRTERVNELPARRRDLNSSSWQCAIRLTRFHRRAAKQETDLGEELVNLSGPVRSAERCRICSGKNEVKGACEVVMTSIPTDFRMGTAVCAPHGISPPFRLARSTSSPAWVKMRYGSMASDAHEPVGVPSS